MSNENFELLLKLYYELSDFYFDVDESETTQDERDELNNACESIMNVIEAHATSSERQNMLP